MTYTSLCTMPSCMELKERGKNGTRRIKHCERPKTF